MSNINIETLLSETDFSKGTEVFSEQLLHKCLSVLGQEDEGTEGFAEISDEQLDFLAAAGNPLADQDADDPLL